MINDGTKPPEKPPEVLPATVVEPETEMVLTPHADFTMKDLESIKKFRDEGMSGLAHITDVDCERMMALYMDGKSYRQISQVLKKQKTVIMFLAHKFKWYELRQDYLGELQATLKDKIVESKLQTKEFLLELILAYQKKIGRSVHQYLRTDDVSFADRIDVKDVNTVLKVMELLHKIDIENINDKSLVGLNGLGEGMTITKTGANSVEITPKSPYGSKLKAFADMKRDQERAASPPSRPLHDIIVEKPLTEKTEKEEEK